MSITERIDAITKISPEYLQEKPPAPRSVKIELTQRCNYRCAFCALQFRETSTTDLDWELFKRITHEMREAGVDWQMVSYGGAVHAFTVKEAGNDNSKGVAYNERADKRSWEAMKQFFSEIFK